MKRSRGYEVFRWVSALTSALACSFASAQAPEGGKLLFCLVPPVVQISQAAPSADPVGPVVSTMVSYLSGPIADVQLLQARIAVQFNAEAVQRGCGFIIQSSIVHKKPGTGVARLLAAAPSVMDAMPFLDGVAEAQDIQAATQTANAARQAVAAVQAVDAKEDSEAAMSGMAAANIGKGDQMILTFRLLRVGQSQEAAGRELRAKATKPGQDILSPLLEQMASEVLAVGLGG